MHRELVMVIGVNGTGKLVESQLSCDTDRACVVWAPANSRGAQISLCREDRARLLKQVVGANGPGDPKAVNCGIATTALLGLIGAGDASGGVRQCMEKGCHVTGSPSSTNGSWFRRRRDCHQR
jgi:hypothetical protein